MNKSHRASKGTNDPISLSVSALNCLQWAVKGLCLSRRLNFEKNVFTKLLCNYLEFNDDTMQWVRGNVASVLGTLPCGPDILLLEYLLFYF